MDNIKFVKNIEEQDWIQFLDSPLPAYVELDRLLKFSEAIKFWYLSHIAYNGN
jgi:hypothetical protein